MKTQVLAGITARDPSAAGAYPARHLSRSAAVQFARSDSREAI